MRVIFSVKTPRGEASKTQKKIRGLIIGFKKVSVETHINDDDSELIWIVDGRAVDIYKINRNLSMFDYVIKNIFSSSLMKKYGLDKLPKNELEELKELLEKQTSVKVIKFESGTDENYETFYQKLKNKFKRVFFN